MDAEINIKDATIARMQAYIDGVLQNIADRDLLIAEQKEALEAKAWDIRGDEAATAIEHANL